MNKRHAKRWANTHAALIIDSAMTSGFPWEYGFSDKDTDKIIDALEGIKTSLHRKGLYVEDPEILRPVDKGWRNRNERIQAR
jgi:hypothetical protein